MLNSIKYNIKRLLKKPFKIGMITYRYPGEGALTSGVGIHVYNLSRELSKLGCDVHVFCYGERKHIKREYIGDGKLTIHRMTTKLPLFSSDDFLKHYLSAFIFDNKIMEEVVKENSSEKFDIIHSNGRLLGGIFVSKYLGNIKWVNTIHSLEKNRLQMMSKEEKKYVNIFRWMEDTIKHADAIITVSKKLKQETLKNYDVKEKNVFAIPNGCDTMLFKPMKIFNTNDEEKILYVGRFSLEKGIDFLPKIIRKVFSRNNKVKFEIVASDKEIPVSLEKTKKEFEYLIEKFPERIIWHRKPLEREDLVKIYNESTLVIQPSRYDSFPTTVLEAMACGKTVICSDRGGMPEMVDDAGVIIPLSNYSFAREILRLLKDYRLRERYNRRAIERVQKYSWENIGKQTLELYKVIAKKTNEEDKGKKDYEKVHEGLQNLDGLNKEKKENN